MKLQSVMITLAILLASCSQTDVPEIVKEQPEQNGVSNIRSVNEAIDMALTASEAFYPSGSRGGKKKVSNPLQVKAKYSSASRSGGPLYYVVNFDDDMGFAIIPAAADNEMVLAVTESGNVDPNIPSRNEGFNSYLCAVEDYLNSDIPDSLKVSPFSANAAVKELLKVGPRVKMLPHQNHPEGLNVAYGIAGCGPVGLLMAMSYLKQPELMRITYQPVLQDYNLYINWDSIAMHDASKHSGELNIGCKVEEGTHKKISDICAEIGHVTDTKYSASGATTYSKELFPYIKTILPSNSFIIIEHLFVGDIDNALWDGIILIEGSHRIFNSASNEYDYISGHYWIADGVQRYVYNYGPDPFGNPHYGLISTEYFHFNWGWGGSCNGYFSPNVYDPNEGSIYDGPSNISKYHYNYLDSGVVFLDPSENKYQQP